MSDKVSELIAVFDHKPKEEYYECVRRFLINNQLLSSCSIQILVEELKNRLEVKEKAATLVGSLTLPVVLGYLIFLLENDAINRTPWQYGCTLGLITVFLITVLFVSSWFVGKKGYIWRIRTAISVLHEIELELISDNHYPTK